jgi:hypothetical protein
MIKEHDPLSRPNPKATLRAAVERKFRDAVEAMVGAVACQPDDREDLREDQELWCAEFERKKVRGGVVAVVLELTRSVGDPLRVPR